MSKVCWQINLQRHFGGGEVYTGFVAKALQARGWKVKTVVSSKANFWSRMDLAEADLVRVKNHQELLKALPSQRSLLLHHGAPHREIRDSLANHHHFTAIAHMPVHNRDPEPFRSCVHVYGVSAYVVRTLREKGLDNVYLSPLYGVADLDRPSKGKSRIVARSRYDWDERKLRDRLLKYVYPLRQAVQPARIFSPRPGLSLGIVSRLTTIKQFPELLRTLTPVLERHPGVNLEIFGAGGWRSVHDLEEILTPIQERVRWWGFQQDVRRVYGLVDFVLSGLPELEALGLNLLEAQAVGTPVLAVDAPPFDETVINGRGGFRYQDPREDQGADFEALLTQLISGHRPESPLPPQLQRFSLDSFGQRLERALEQIH